MVLRNVAWDRSAWLGLAVTIGCALAIGSGRGSGRTAGVPDSRPTAAAIDASNAVGVPRSYHLAASVSLDHVPGGRLLPTDVALGPDGTMYVADFTSHTVVVFNADGSERERWRHQLGSLECDVEFVPVALDTTAAGGVAILWHSYSEHNGVILAGRTAGFVDLRNSDGEVTSMFQVRYEYTDMALFGDNIYLAQNLHINVNTRNGMVDVSRRMMVTWTRDQAGSFDLLSDGRVARVKVDGTVHIETTKPYTTRLVDIGGMTPLAVDAVGATLHIVAVDSSTAVVHHFQADAEGRRLSDTSLALPYQATTIGAWPLSIAAQPDGLVVVTANDDGLVLSRLDAADQTSATVQGDAPQGVNVNEPRLRGWTACGDGNASLGTATDDGIAVYDHDAQRLVAYDGQLQQLGTRSVVSPLLSIDTLGPLGGDIVMTTRSGRLIRTPWEASSPPVWDVAGPCAENGRVTWSGAHLVAACRADKRLWWINAATGLTGRDVVGTSTSALWPFDVGVFPDGEVVATDLIEKRLQRYAADGTPLADVAAGYAVGPQFVAAVKQSDIGRVAVTSMWDGYLELREVATGNLLVRWPADERGVRMRVADIGLDAQLRVYVLDGRKRVLYRYDPQAEDAPAAGATPTPSRTSCLVQGDKRAGPQRVILGETASVTLTLRADCPLAHTDSGADIVLVADNSGSMVEVTEALRKAVTDISGAVDLRRHRLGLVVFRVGATVASPLSHTPRDLGAMILDPRRSGGEGTDIAAGLATARSHLLTAGDPAALPIVILLSDGQSDAAASMMEAQRTKDAGIQIFAVAMGGLNDPVVLRHLASSPKHFFATWTPDDLYLMVAQLSHEATASRIGNVVIRDEMSPDVELVADSAFPPVNVGNQQVTWGRGVLASTGITLSVKVRPLNAGLRIPTNRQAIADYTDADGSARQFVFPVPYIDVVAPTPSPTAAPTATPTASATVPAGPSIAYLPLALREAPCQPELQPLDVVLVLDASNSMTGDKLAAAQNAARAFVDMLRLGKDRVGLVTFSTDARLMIGQTTDGAAFVGAVDRIALSAGTRMDSGLALALGTMLASPRPDAKQAVVLLTDGRQDAEPQAAVDAAAALRRAGIDVLAVGLGGDADAAFLAQLVDDPRKVRHAGDATALAEVYRQIARELPCDRAVWWGGR